MSEYLQKNSMVSVTVPPFSINKDSKRADKACTDLSNIHGISSKRNKKREKSIHFVIPWNIWCLAHCFLIRTMTYSPLTRNVYRFSELIFEITASRRMSPKVYFDTSRNTWRVCLHWGITSREKLQHRVKQYWSFARWHYGCNSNEL